MAFLIRGTLQKAAWMSSVYGNYFSLELEILVTYCGKQNSNITPYTRGEVILVGNPLT